MIKTMVIEPVSAFNGMDVLVARDEGLFAAEGLDLRIRQPSAQRPALLRRRHARTPGDKSGPPARTRRSPHVPGLSLRQ